MSNTKKGILAGIISNTIFGFSFIFTTICLNETSVLITLSYRSIIALITLFIVMLIFKVKIKIDKKDLPLLIIMGLCQPSIYFLCENYGILYSSTSFASVMLSVIPIICIILGVTFLKEKVTIKQIIYACLAVVGVILISISNWTGGHIKLLGIVLLLGAVISAAVFSIFSRKLSTKYSSLQRTFMMFLISTITFTSIAFFQNINQLDNFIKPLSNYKFVLSVLYLGTISSVVAFMLVNVANTNLPVSKSTVFSCLSTVISVVVGIVLLKEPYSIITIIATFIILFGVYKTQSSDKKKRDS